MSTSRLILYKRSISRRRFLSNYYYRLGAHSKYLANHIVILFTLYINRYVPLPKSKVALGGSYIIDGAFNIGINKRRSSMPCYAMHV
jgi:hypothetical protein